MQTELRTGDIPNIWLIESSSRALGDFCTIAEDYVGEASLGTWIPDSVEIADDDGTVQRWTGGQLVTVTVEASAYSGDPGPVAPPSRCGDPDA